MLLQLLGSDPLVFFILVIALIFSLVLHELGHAVAALWAGDTTARDQGRITLNPLSHLDPIGTLMLLIAGFGWARPVPVWPPNFRHYRVGLFVVSIAGIVINLFIAVLSALTIRLLVTVEPNLITTTFQLDQRDPLNIALLSLYYLASLNITLAVFNLLPVPPLDGSKIINSLAPVSVQRFLWRLEANPTYAIVALLVFLTVLRQPIAQLIGAVQDWFFKLML